MNPTAVAGARVAPAAGRRARLLHAIQTHGGVWTTSRAHALYGRSAPQMGTARRDLDRLHRAGHLDRHDDDHNGRRYTPRTSA